ncbi:unnamed protein product [Durusdinium trenchii]|uniref:Ubiquitin carboxyl-terminal hydrolase n=1 Tax=Durusdinium trenchii TaxID=1381693 RepID=A0ABP0K444_9DINO
MEVNGGTHLINGLLTEKPLLPRVIEFVKASADAGHSVTRDKHKEDADDEPPKPQFYLFSRERLVSLFHESSPRRVGRGLRNLGNTCFFNSVLQVLTYTGPLQNLLLSKQHSRECISKREGTVCTLCLLESHAQEVFDIGKAPMKPTRLLSHMPQIASRFRAQGRQEDAHEFLIHFLDACHKSILKQATQQPVPRPVQQTSVICQLFGGFLRSQVLCLKCKYASNTFDPFMDISLEVSKASTLEKALDAFTTSEQLRGANKYQCKQCKQKVDATKRFSIHSSPPLLSFQLKRFDFSHGSRGKLQKNVKFPLSLNIAPYTSHRDREAKYNLYGLVVHCGQSAKSGHYVAFAKHNGNWFQFNDEAIRQVKEQQVLGQEAYLLFYQTAEPPLTQSQPLWTDGVPNTVKQAFNGLTKDNGLQKLQKEHLAMCCKVQCNGAPVAPNSERGNEPLEVKSPRPSSGRPQQEALKVVDPGHLVKSPSPEVQQQPPETRKRSRLRSRLDKLRRYQASVAKLKASSSLGGETLAEVATTTDYARQYGQAEVEAWESPHVREDLRFLQAQEALQPRPQKRDEIDQDYDVGKRKHKPRKPKVVFEGRSLFDKEEQRRRAFKQGGAGSKGGKGGKGGKGKAAK